MLVEQLDDSTFSENIQKQSEAHYHFIKGTLALHEEKYQIAIEELKRAASLETGSAIPLRFRLMDLYLENSNVEAAIKVADKILELHTKEDPTIELFEKLKAEMLVATNDKKAKEWISKIVNKDDKKDVLTSNILLSSIYAKNNNKEIAKEILQTVMQKNANRDLTYIYLSRLLEEEANLIKAKTLLRKALKTKPNSTIILNELAKLLIRQEKTDEALKILLNSIEIKPTNNIAQEISQQVILYKAGKLQQLEQLVKFEPFRPSIVLRKMGINRLKKRDLVIAKWSFLLALHANPNDDQARYLLAVTLSTMQRKNEAKKHLLAIREDSLHFEESRLLAVFMQKNNKDYKEAIETLKQLLKRKNVEKTKFLPLLVNLQKESKDINEAIKTQKEIVSLFPKDDKQLFALALLYEVDNQHSKAVNTMEKVISMNPKNASALNHLGYILAERGERLEEALDLINRAIAIDANNGYYIDSLGWVYFKMGKNDRAIENLQKAVELTPNDAIILEHLAILYRSLGNYDLARHYFKKALLNAPKSEETDLEERLINNIRNLE